jgi:uncharacterized membrane protein
MLALQGADATIAILNMLCLIFISFVPFTVSVATNWSSQFYAALLVNLNLLLIGLPLLLIWLYGIYKRRYIYQSDVLPTQSLVLITLRFLFPMIFYGISIGVAALNIWVSYGITCVVALIYVLGVFGLDFYRIFNRGLFYLLRKASVCDKLTKLQEKQTQHYLDSHEYHEEIVERIKGFADALFAIVVTVLVLQLHAPHKPHDKEMTPAQLNEQLGRELVSHDIYPVYISFFVTAIVTGIYWKNHAYMMKDMHRSNRLFVFMNILLLAVASFIPFTADLVGKHPNLVVSAASYNLVLVIMGLLSLTLFVISHYKGRLKKIQAKFVPLVLLRVFTPPIIYAIAFGIAFVQ